MSLNRVMLIGHLGQDPELRHLPTSGQPVASFSVATDEAYTDKQGQRQQRVDWHNIVVFGRAAESCKEYLKKGREYELKDNGGKRQRAEIIASRVQFLGTPPADAKAAAEVNGDLASDEAPF